MMSTMMTLLWTPGSHMTYTPLALLTILLTLNKPDLTPVEPNPLLFMDDISYILVTMALWVTMIILPQSQNTQSLPLMLMTSVLCCLAFVTKHTFSFWVFFETSLIPVALMMVQWGYPAERLSATMYMLTFTIVSSSTFLVVMFSHHKLFWGLSLMTSTTLNQPAAMLLIFMFLVKSPVYLVHSWLPKAHVESSTWGSMLLAALLLKLGSYGMLRLAPVMPFPSSLIMCTTVCLTGSLLISLSMIIHPDLKYIIAVSSVVHMSYATLQTLTQTTYSAHGSIIALITHSYISSGMFLIAGELSNNSNSRNMLLNTKIASNNPCLYFWALVTFFANVGAPPFMSFLSELAIIKMLLPKGFLSLSLWFATNFILMIQTLLLISLISSASLPSSAKPPAVKISLSSFILLSPATIMSPWPL